MNNKLIFQILVLFLPLLSFGQQRWENVINDEDFGLVRNNLSYDFGQLISTVTGSNGSHTSVLIKTDKNGQQLWRKTLIYDDWIIPNGAKQDKNGKLIVYGGTNNDASIVKLDACGNLLWCSKYNESENFTTYYTDAVFLDNGNIILSMQIDNNDGVMDMGLMCFDTAGNMLWFHPFNLIPKYPFLKSWFMPWQLKKFDNFLIISGLGYYSYPDNPSLGMLKPMFVKTDSNYYEQWLLPYGVADSSTNDTILGIASGVVSYYDGILHGWGRGIKPTQNYYTSILMNFDTSGQETNYHIITNEMLDSTVTENFFLDVYQRDDTSYFTSIKYGNQDWENPSGEVIIDTAGNVYQKQSHPNADLQGGYWPIAKDTVNNQYYLAYYNFDWDIVLYKFNADLSDVPYDTTTYTYDSLCNNLPIVSDTVYVTGCDVITSVPQFPSPEAWQKARQTVELAAYPNPAHSSTVNFKLKYTKYHSNMQLTVYDISGKQRASLPLATGQKTVALRIAGYAPGMYVAVVRDRYGVLGKVVFGVR